MLSQVTKGSKEELRVAITDNGETPITDLSTSVPKFEIMDDAAFKLGDGTYANAIASTAVGMTIKSIVDHNTAGTPWIVGDYRLFVWFVVATQQIRKGPYHYQVVE